MKMAKNNLFKMFVVIIIMSNIFLIASIIKINSEILIYNQNFKKSTLLQLEYARNSQKWEDKSSFQKLIIFLDLEFYGKVSKKNNTKLILRKLFDELNDEMGTDYHVDEMNYLYREPQTNNSAMRKEKYKACGKLIEAIMIKKNITLKDVVFLRNKFNYLSIGQQKALLKKIIPHINSGRIHHQKRGFTF